MGTPPHANGPPPRDALRAHRRARTAAGAAASGEAAATSGPTVVGRGSPPPQAQPCARSSRARSCGSARTPSSGASSNCATPTATSTPTVTWAPSPRVAEQSSGSPEPGARGLRADLGAATNRHLGACRGGHRRAHGGGAGTQAQLLFEIRPAQAEAIDPRPLIEAWGLLEATQSEPRPGTQPLFGPDAGDALVSEVLLMSAPQLERACSRNRA